MNGTAVCFGSDENGQSSVPHAALSGVVSVSAGSAHSCALRVDRSVVCWGYIQWVDNAVYRSGALSVSAGGLHTCAALVGGNVICWGYDRDGQDVPSDLVDVFSVSAGTYHSCAIKRDSSSVVCWGAWPTLGHSYGQVAPVDASDASNVISVSAGGKHTCTGKMDGSVACWGLKESYRASGPDVVTDIAAPGFAVSVSAGAYHTCAAKADGSMLCSGHNNFDQTNVPATAASGVISVAAGENTPVPPR